MSRAAEQDECLWTVALHANDSVAVRIRQRADEDGVDDAEEGGGGAGADGERQNDRRGKPR